MRIVGSRDETSAGGNGTDSLSYIDVARETSIRSQSLKSRHRGSMAAGLRGGIAVSVSQETHVTEQLQIPMQDIRDPDVSLLGIALRICSELTTGRTDTQI